MKGNPQPPVDCITARRLLSPKGNPDFPMGATRFAAIRRAMGINKGRHVVVADIVAWLAAHPGFSEKEVYKRKGGPMKKSCMVGDALEFRHGPWVFKFRVVSLGADGKPNQLTLITQ